MKLETQIRGKRAVIIATGRLDAAWAEHFHGKVQETIRDGNHHVRIDAEKLDYLSSAGIRSLLRIQRELTAVKGSFGIIRASPLVADTLRLSGLEQLMQPENEVQDAGTVRDGRTLSATTEYAENGIHFEIHKLAPQGQVVVRAGGGWKSWQPVNDGDAVDIGFPREVFGLGIGAPGRNADEVRGRLGEFVAAAGCVAWLPGDGADRPDYLEQAEHYVPRLRAIQALVGQGVFTRLLRFHPLEKGSCLAFSNLSLQVLKAVQADSAAMICLAEAEGLVGAALARSPGLIGASDRPGDFPAIRDWMSFCGERVYRQELAMAVAFFSRDSAHANVPGLSALPSRPEIRAHAHAVILPFRSLPQGVLELEQSVRAVFGESAPLGLLHLVEDDRPAVGLGESAFTRGVCWCAPLQFSTELLS